MVHWNLLNFSAIGWVLTVYFYVEAGGWIWSKSEGAYTWELQHIATHKQKHLNWSGTSYFHLFLCSFPQNLQTLCTIQCSDITFKLFIWMTWMQGSQFYLWPKIFSSNRSKWSKVFLLMLETQQHNVLLICSCCRLSSFVWHILNAFCIGLETRVPQSWCCISCIF